MLFMSTGKRPGLLLSILQYTGQPSPHQPTVTQPNRPVLTNPGVSEDKSPSLLSSVVELGCSLKVMEEVNPSLSKAYNVHIGSSKSLKLKESLHLLHLASQFLPGTPYKLREVLHDLGGLDFSFQRPDFFQCHSLPQVCSLWVALAWAKRNGQCMDGEPQE